jgi:hypothetical protein
MPRVVANQQKGRIMDSSEEMVVELGLVSEQTQQLSGFQPDGETVIGLE